MRSQSSPSFAVWFATFIVALTFIGFRGPALAQTVNWEAYCDANAKRVVLLVDITTPYDEQDKSILVDGLGKIVGKLGDGDRIIIRTIGDSFAHSEQLIERCVPYCPPLSFWDELFSNCTGGLILNHKRTMLSDIKRVVRQRLDQFKELEHSDVIRTIAGSASEEMAAGGGQLQMYIFSDLIENSDFIPGDVFFSADNDALLAKVRDSRLVPNLTGAHVNVFGVGRGGGAARTPLPVGRLNKVIDFWNSYFEATGASATINQNLVVN